MRKFAFLLALAALFAMSSAAFAAAGDITPAAYSGASTKAVNNDGPADNSGWKANAFYYGTVQDLIIGVDCTFDTGPNGGDKYGALVGTATTPIYSTVPVASGTTQTPVWFTVPFSASDIAMKLASYKEEGNEKKSTTDATLTVTPVELEVTAMTATEDVKDKPFTVKTNELPFDIVVEGKAGTVDELVLTNLVVKTGDTNVPTSGSDNLAQWDSSSGNLSFDPSKAKAGDTLTITVKAPETNSAKVLKTATNTEVAGVTGNTVFATISIKFVDYIVEPATAAWDGNATPPSSVTFTVKDLTADKISKIEIKASGVGSDVLDPANYTATTNGSDVEIELKLEYLEGLSKNDYTFTITGESNKTADFVLSVTPKAEKSYAADPSSATWDGTSGVKFKVDMPHSDFNAIGVKSPNDEDVRELGKDYYTVTPTADGIEVELKAEYLLSLTATGDYVYYVGDLKGRPALFTLTVAGKYNVPDVGVEPSFESVEEPAGVQFGINQTIMDREKITAIEPKIIDFLDGDGKIEQEKAADLIGVDKEALTVLPILGASLDAGKTIAAFTFDVAGLALVSEDVEGIRWYDAIIHKMYVDPYAPASTTLRPARTWGAVANGTYMIMDKDGKQPLADDYVIEPDSTRYKLVVYVQDNSEYDLNKDPRSVADPVAIQTSSGGRSKSSSGCDAGVFAPLAAIACLAALGLVKRRAR